MATKEGVRSRNIASVDRVLNSFWHVFVAFTRNIPKKLIRSIGLGDYIHHRAVGTQYRNGFCNPTPSNYFVVCAYISAFARLIYWLTVSKLVSLHHYMRPCVVSCCLAGWDNPLPRLLLQLSPPLLGVTPKPIWSSFTKANAPIQLVVSQRISRASFHYYYRR